MSANSSPRPILYRATQRGKKTGTTMTLGNHKPQRFVSFQAGLFRRLLEANLPAVSPGPINGRFPPCTEFHCRFETPPFHKVGMTMGIKDHHESDVRITQCPETSQWPPRLPPSAPRRVFECGLQHGDRRLNFAECRPAIPNDRTDKHKTVPRCPSQRS